MRVLREMAMLAFAATVTMLLIAGGATLLGML